MDIEARLLVGIRDRSFAQCVAEALVDVGADMRDAVADEGSLVVRAGEWDAIRLNQCLVYPGGRISCDMLGTAVLPTTSARNFFSLRSSVCAMIDHWKSERKQTAS
jgi:hypothetical protein